MGSRGSKSKLEAAREPAALLKTDHGVIVRTIDHASGDSTYHNLQSRVAASVVASPVAATSSTVPVARAGPNNAEMKDKVLYVKKAPRASR